MKSTDEEIKMNPDSQETALLPKKKGVSNMVKFYFLAVIACFLFGSKLFLLEMAHFTKIWIFFIEHIAVLISAIILFFMYYLLFKRHMFSLSHYLTKECSFVKSRKTILYAFISGGCNALGNVSIIFAIKFARDSGSSSSAINSILMLNILIALVAGLCIFGERHSPMQYFGGLMIIGAILLITFERSISKPGTYNEYQNNLHYISIFFTLVTCFFWSMMIISTKYACFHYDVNIIEYSSCAMGLSGFVGCLFGIPILYYHTPMNFMPEDKMVVYILFAVFSGLFTTIGQFTYFAAVNIGSVEVGQLFVNMKPIAQLVEEAIFLFLFPNLLQLVGIFIAILGAGLVILGKKEGQHQHADDNAKSDAIK
ncbi:unnamed protein product [Moneuplotes crassus]|uniref:EamA domain-containing protein n=2 Tax=Euplotes crassus TaxID=5936 RepID=A0AAD2CXC0_EUPCR|nr:unnamed protein product [Moneuplotes crassus]